MSKLEVRSVTNLDGETDLKLGKSGGTVTLADGATPIGWDKAAYTAAYSVASYFPDSNVQLQTGFMPIAQSSGTSSSGADFVVGQNPIGLEVAGTGEPEARHLKITKSGVYLIYTAVSARTNGSSTPMDKIWANAYVNGVNVRDASSQYAPTNFNLRTDSNATSYIYHAMANDTWTGLLQVDDEVQFFYYAKSKSGYVRVPGLVGSIIYVGDSD